MDLYVDDFGCVPDGRFLERVSIDAASVVLTVPGGGLRAVDVGKNIAIPGAADLVAEIAALARRQEVLNASIAAGSDVLTGTLVDPDDPDRPLPFRADLHVGLRITIADAGVGGQTLFSDVLQVIDRDTVRLADQAAATVDGVEVILNDPEVVALSNYARRSVEDLVVELRDRSITDGAVRIGGRGLRSATAKFSSRDLNKQVTLREAGLFVTTIQSFEDSNRVRLAAPAPRAVQNVAADVWKTDSRPGFEGLLAALPSLNTEGGEVRFGPGAYDFSRIPDLADRLNAAIGLRGVSNLTLRGSGAGATILRLMPNQDLSAPDTHVIETIDCRNLTLRDLSVHGAYLTMGNSNEQMHGININEGSEEIAITRVQVFQSAGDGIRLLGRPKNDELGTPAIKVRKIWLDGCGLVQNKRTGVAFQRAVESVWVRNCYIEMSPPSSDSCMDFEPTANTAPTDIIVDSNVMVHDTSGVAVSLSGISGPDPTRRIKFVNNIVLGGTVFCTDVDQLTIHNNTVVVPDDLRQAGRIPLHVQRGGHAVLISGNTLLNEHPDARGMIAISEVNNRPVDRTVIAGNLCFTRAGAGIQVTSCEDVTVDANLVVARGSCTQGVLVHTTSVSEVGNIAVRNNDITVEGGGSWITGIQVGGGASTQHTSVMGNSISGASEGVKFAGRGFRRTPVCALNRVHTDVENPLVGLPTLPEQAVVVGGAASRGGTGPATGVGRFLVGSQHPEGNVAGNLGDIYQRIDAVAGPRLFVKEADDGAVTGWSAK